MSQMSPEEEEAVQAELEALQREALVSTPGLSKVSSSGIMTDRAISLLYPLCRSTLR